MRSSPARSTATAWAAPLRSTPSVATSATFARRRSLAARLAFKRHLHPRVRAQLAGGRVVSSGVAAAEVFEHFGEGRGTVGRLDVAHLDAAEAADAGRGVGPAERRLDQLLVLDGGDGLLPRAQVRELVLEAEGGARRGGRAHL